MEDYRLIPLTGKHGTGKFAKVDRADLASAQAKQWYVLVTPHGKAYVYAGRAQERTSLHRFLMGSPSGMDVDHINGDPLDNRRSNLRVCSRSQNNCNRKGLDNATSRFKGVYFDRSRGHNKWRAAIKIRGRRHRLGSFDSEVEAAHAYDLAAKRLHGEFARTNF